MTRPVGFTVTNRYLGYTVEYFDGGTAEHVAGSDQAADYESEIFVEKAVNALISASQMITHMLVVQNRPKEALVVDATFEKAFQEGKAVQNEDFRFDCEPDSLALQTPSGLRDIKSLTFRLELTVMPKRSS
jgi:hypothetical protein